MTIVKKEDSDKKDHFDIDRRTFLKKMGAGALTAVFGIGMFSSKGFAAGKKSLKDLEKKIKDKKLPKVHLPTVAQVKDDLRRASDISKIRINKISISPIGVDPEELKRKIKEYRAAGIDVDDPDKNTESSANLAAPGPILASSYIDCNDLVVAYSWVYVNNDDYRYFAHDTACESIYNCSTIRPSESSYSDIHLEEWYYFYSDGVRPSVTTRGLIVFAGSNDNCGTPSTHLRDSNGNLQTYSDLPLDNPGGWYIWGAHILTTPCPHRDCVTWFWFPWDVDDNPQRLVFKKYQTST